MGKREKGKEKKKRGKKKKRKGNNVSARLLNYWVPAKHGVNNQKKEEKEGMLHEYPIGFVSGLHYRCMPT